MIRKYKGSEVNDNIKVDYAIIQNGSNYPLFSYVIFERDNWPAPDKGSTFDKVSGYTFNQHYRSYEGKYDHQVLSLIGGNQKFRYIRGFQNETSSVKYNFK